MTKPKENLKGENKFLLGFAVTNDYSCRGDIIETVDVEGGGLIACKDDVRVTQSPFEPMAEEMSFDPAISMLRILQKFQIIYLKCDLSVRRVNVSS